MLAAQYDLTPDDELRALLLSDYLAFTRTFFKLRTGNDFELSNPAGRESHFITIAKALMRVYTGEVKYLMINVPPRYGKSELLISFVAWGLANHPDASYIYTSYAQSLASMQTSTIRDIISLPAYGKLFNVHLDKNTGAKDDFRVTPGGGRVFAAGCGGPITGRGCGVKGVTRWGGCALIDDAHKPDEVTSDISRSRVNNWFYNTLQSRRNSPDTPIIAIGQMLHEDDLLANLRNVVDVNGNPIWEIVCLPALDVAGNALYPEMHSKEALLELQRHEEYVFASQYQQNPLPAGGGIFKKDNFIYLDNEPEILSTFLTIDTAETDKDWNDASVFSYFGVYRVVIRGIDTGMYGLHWLDCKEVRVEPKDLEAEFFDFYAQCMRHSIKPYVTLIEKKSTGVTLASCLKTIPGLRILDIDRTVKSGNKTARFLACQPFVSQKRITFTRGAKHAEMCINHASKITANNSHAHDDIMDTLADAIQGALIDRTLLPPVKSDNKTASIINSKSQLISQLTRRQGL